MFLIMAELETCSDLRDEISKLKLELLKKNEEIDYLKAMVSSEGPQLTSNSEPKEDITDRKVLSKEEIARYSRQLILPELGVQGQLKLRHQSVLIVGAGGLGCPVAVYLAAAGIGKIGVVDYDDVEINNLHRQILHTESKLNFSKVASIVKAIKELNSFVECVPHHLQLKSDNALQLIEQYNIVVDATDNVATRYLLNDACVFLGKPLVSGSALRFEGQLTIYNHDDGPCYRCLFPIPPPPGSVTNCSDGGVIGAVPGVIGCLQALEVLKLSLEMEVSYNKKMLIFDGMTGMFRIVKLRSKKPGCCVCGDNPTVKHLIDYEQFCGVAATDKDRTLHLLKNEERISCQEYHGKTVEQCPHLLIDVRPKTELDICGLKNAYNLPIDQIDNPTSVGQIQDIVKKSVEKFKVDPLPVFVVCRRGNDSQTAVKSLKSHLGNFPVTIQDLKGGLHAWAKEVDPQFPIY